MSEAERGASGEELLLGVGQVAVRAKELERAVAFYRDALGMRFLFRAPGAGAFFDCGGVRLMLGPAEDAATDHPASVLYYRVADIDAAHAGLRSRGVPFVDEPHLVARLPDHELWMAFFHDSEGNLAALMGEKR